MSNYLVRWDPFREFLNVRHDMDRLFDAPLARRPSASPEQRRLPLDAYVTDEELVITANVPGLAPEDVEVTLEEDVLTIKGEIPAPLGNVEYAIQERAFGSFVRTIRLNVPVQADKVSATFTHGVLTITLPKVEEVKPKTIQVQVKS